MSDNAFVLFGNCVPVQGASRSVICDLQLHRIKFITHRQFDVLVGLANASGEGPWVDPEIRAFLDELAAEHYGFWSKDSQYFPPMDLTWDMAARCTNAIIDIEPDPKYPIAAVLGELDELGCRFLQVRAFEAVTVETIEALVRTAETYRFRSLDLVLKESPSVNVEFFQSFCAEHVVLSRVVLHSAERDSRAILRPLPIDVWTITEPLKLQSCGVVDPRFFCVNTGHFAEARAFNSCLNRKLSVNSAGEIKACPSMVRSFGNVRATKLRDVLDNKELRALWTITKDQVDVCKDCEFRYVCTDCRANTVDGQLYSKPASCRYDPYTATWE